MADHPRLRPAMVMALSLIVAAAAAGCTSSASSSSSGAADGGAAAPPSAAAAGPAAPENGFAAGGASAAASSSGSSSAAGSGGGKAAADAARLAAGGQQLIYTAQLSVRVSSVQSAVSQATSIVTAAGGYVATEKATTPPDGKGQASAVVELKIPAAAYQRTLAALAGTGLGTRLSLTQQAQDVTQQVADVNSRVASDQAAITQLRELLKRAGSVAELLSVQDQINTEESDLESMLAQQRSLDHETAYATVTLSLVGPKAAAAKAKPASPPPGLASGASSGWHAFTVTIGWVLTALGAMAPFIAAVLVIGGIVWWVRRRGHRERTSS